MEGLRKATQSKDEKDHQREFNFSCVTEERQWVKVRSRQLRLE